MNSIGLDQSRRTYCDSGDQRVGDRWSEQVADWSLRKKEFPDGAGGGRRLITTDPREEEEELIKRTILFISINIYILRYLNPIQLLDLL